MLKNDKISVALAELEQSVHAALETYSNVHRGSGHNSMVSTHLFEQARNIVLDYLDLNKSRYVVVFCTPRRAEILTKQIDPGSYQLISSQDIGLSLGVRAIAVQKKSLPKGVPFQTGGGSARLISQDWVIWAKAPDKFEAGTPAIVNVIAFAKALLLIRKLGKNIFLDPSAEKLTINEILYHDELKEFTGLELLDKFRETLIGRNNLVPTMEGIRSYINLDNSASTPTFAPIWNTFRHTLSQTAQAQQEIIHEVKSICSGFLGAPLADYDFIFTSNTTEAINLAAESLGRESEDGIEPVVVNTLLEHSSNDLPWRMVKACSLIRLSINGKGFIDLDELETVLRKYNQEHQYGNKRVKIVAISGASNVLGVCNNIAEISMITHKYGAHLLVDAAQLIAHRKIDMEVSGIDYLAFSAHKVYAPFGCGALVARKGMLKFSSEELKYIQSSGEENTGGVAALGKSFTILDRIGMDLIREEEQAITRRALHGMSQIPGLSIYGIKKPHSPNFAQKLGVIVFDIKGVIAFKVAKELAVQSGIGVRSGCLCSHILIKRLLGVSPGLEKFQRVIVSLFPKLSLPGLVRVSFGMENTEAEIDKLILALNKIAKKQTDSSQKASVKKQIQDFVIDSGSGVFD